MKAATTYADSILLPNIIELKSNLFLAQFKIMKLLPAKYIIEAALKKGLINQKSYIIESSSGTFALGLALICRQHNLSLHIISDPVIDASMSRKLMYLGAQVHIVKKPANVGGYQTSMLVALKKKLRLDPTGFWPKQYENEDIHKAYKPFANQLIQHFDKAITLIGSVGTGGSTSGTIQPLRDRFPAAKLVGIDSYNSVIFGQPDGKRLLRGLGNSIVPKNVKHSLYDQIHFLTPKEAFLATKKLYSEYGIFSGPTTGAAFLVAQWYAKEHPNETVIFIGPDEGDRYVDTVYNDIWLKQHNAYLSQSSYSLPRMLESAKEVSNAWGMVEWDKRELKEMLK